MTLFFGAFENGGIRNQGEGRFTVGNIVQIESSIGKETVYRVGWITVCVGVQKGDHIVLAERSRVGGETWCQFRQFIHHGIDVKHCRAKFLGPIVKGMG